MVSSRSPEDSDGGGCSCFIGYCGLAYKDVQQIQTLPALLCLLFAWVMQIDSNLVNDYFDFKHGNDDETRLGPKRACAEGWITLGAMKWGIILTTLLGCAIGFPLVLFGGWEMVIVGICCVVFCFLYTTCLSYLGHGRSSGTALLRHCTRMLHILSCNARNHAGSKHGNGSRICSLRTGS